MSTTPVTPRLVESLIAQMRLCGGDKCRRPKCKRCRRGVNFRIAS